MGPSAGGSASLPLCPDHGVPSSQLVSEEAETREGDPVRGHTPNKTQSQVSNQSWVCLKSIFLGMTGPWEKSRYIIQPKTVNSFAWVLPPGERPHHGSGLPDRTSGVQRERGVAREERGDRPCFPLLCASTSSVSPQHRAQSWAPTDTSTAGHWQVMLK